jgi:hypothetical protein
MGRVRRGGATQVHAQQVRERDEQRDDHDGEDNGAQR